MLSITVTGWGCHRGMSPRGCHPLSADSEYTEAEALIITYSLNNFPRDDPRYQWVLGWESRFLEVVGEFQRTHSPNLSVAFMAEVKPPLGGWAGTLGCPAPPHPSYFCSGH